MPWVPAVRAVCDACGLLPAIRNRPRRHWQFSSFALEDDIVNHHTMPVHGFPIGSLLLLAVVGIAIVIGVLLLRRYLVGPDGLSAAERKSLEGGEAEVLAMVRQTGGPLPQPELSETVPLSPDDIASALYQLERRKLIERRWDAERHAYLVYAR